MVSFEDVRLGFEEHEVLKGLTFHVAQGETKVLVGESGGGQNAGDEETGGGDCSGRSPTPGKFICWGKNISGMSEDELLAFRTKIGFVFQEGALFDSLSVCRKCCVPPARRKLRRR